MKSLKRLKCDIVLIGDLRRAFDVHQYRSGAGLVVLTPLREKAATLAVMLQHGLVLEDVVFGSRGSEWVLLIVRGCAVDMAAQSLENMGYVHASFLSMH